MVRGYKRADLTMVPPWQGSSVKWSQLYGKKRKKDPNWRAPILTVYTPKPFRKAGTPGYGSKPTNKAEGQCWELLCSEGYLVDKRGWPDFIAFKDGEAIVVEVKPDNWTQLEEQQQRVMEFLTTKGIKAFVWTPETGLVPWREYQPFKG